MSTKTRLYRWIGVGIVLFAAGQHFRFLAVLPDPIFQPDSASYLNGPLSWLEGAGFQVPSERSLGYPFWIAFWLKATQSLWGLLAVQHLLALTAAAANAFMAYRYWGVGPAGTGLIFLLTSTLPRWMVYSHTVLTDVVYASFYIFTLLILMKALEETRACWWGLLAVLTWIDWLIRPVGLAVVGVLAIVILIVRKPAHTKPMLFGILTFIVLCGVACTLNLKYRGFWGFSQFGGVSLFGTTAQYLSPESINDPAVRTVIQRLQGSPSAQWTNSNWVRYDPDGPVAALKAQEPNAEFLHNMLLRLSVAGILNHPLLFTRDQAALFVEFLWKRSQRPVHLLTKDATMVHGMNLYGVIVQSHPMARTLVTFHPSHASSYFNDIAKKALYPYEPTFLTRPLWPWVHAVRWTAMAGLLFSFFLLFLGNESVRRRTLILWLLIASHIVLSNLGGDTDSRHAIPVEPLWILLTVAGVSHASRRWPLVRV